MATNRQANAPIRGYFYQFDKSIIEILESNNDEIIIIEGIEDIDIASNNEDTLIQCKYYEGTSYTPAKIKKAIMLMAKHFSKNVDRRKKYTYHLYAYFKDGHEKHIDNFDIEYLKKTFLTYKHRDVEHRVYEELGLSDQQLEIFYSLLKIDIHAKKYEEQEEYLDQLFKKNFSIKDEEKIKLFRMRADYIVKRLAIEKDQSTRGVTKRDFCTDVESQNNICFDRWLKEKYGEQYYAKSIKKNIFTFSDATHIPHAQRVFIIDVGADINTSEQELVELIKKISDRYSSKNRFKNKSTTPLFCPFLLLRNISTEDLLKTKNRLYSASLKFSDGHIFSGSGFRENEFLAPLDESNPIRLRIFSTEKEMYDILSQIKEEIKVYDFNKETPIQRKKLPSNAIYHPIKIDRIHIIKEAI